MANIAAIDGITGPGRRTILIQGDVNEVNFKLKKKVIEVVTADGNYGSYDMVPTGTIQASTDGLDFTIAITAKQEEQTNG